MNFFEQQHQARSNTKFLVFLFVLAVIGIITTVTLLVTVVIAVNTTRTHYSQPPLNIEELFMSTAMWVAPLTFLLTGLAGAIRILGFGGSGEKVAEFLGGEPLELESVDGKDQQLRNVVEEMAIASGVPVPRIYVLRHEAGINAFAAGTDPSHAVIGVTQGALDTLSRDELQGVIAHEFSHIFNGDMRLNMNLMGAIAGIMFLSTSGRLMMDAMSGSYHRRSSSKDNGGNAIFFFGLGLLLIGSIGAFFASWIKAAVSRQREFLADASAVQFTRNPGGIGGALRRIRDASSTVAVGSAEEASHLFFGEIKSFSIFATHPSIDERIERIGAIHIDSRPERKAKPKFTETLERVGKPSGEDFIKAVTILQGVSEETRLNLRKPKLAMEMVLGVLQNGSGAQELLLKLDPEVIKAIKNVPPDQVLALVDLAIPALRQLDPTHATKFLTAVETLIKEDGEIHPLEIAVLAILRRQLFKGKRSSLRLRQAHKDVVGVLRIMASADGQAEGVARAAFREGAEKIGLTPDEAITAWTSMPNDPSEIVHSLERLSALVPQDKSLLFEAIWLIANHDQTISLNENRYLRAISEALEIPLPASCA